MQDSKKGTLYTLTWGAAVSAALAFLALDTQDAILTELNEDIDATNLGQPDSSYVMVPNLREHTNIQDNRPAEPFAPPALMRELDRIQLAPQRLLAPATTNNLHEPRVPITIKYSSKRAPKPDHVKANKRRVLRNG